MKRRAGMSARWWMRRRQARHEETRAGTPSNSRSTSVRPFGVLLDGRCRLRPPSSDSNVGRAGADARGPRAPLRAAVRSVLAPNRLDLHAARHRQSVDAHDQRRKTLFASSFDNLRTDARTMLSPGSTRAACMHSTAPPAKNPAAFPAAGRGRRMPSRWLHQAPSQDGPSMHRARRVSVTAASSCSAERAVHPLDP